MTEVLSSEPGWIRTNGQLLRRQLLYSTELRALRVGTATILRWWPRHPWPLVYLVNCQTPSYWNLLRMSRSTSTSGDLNYTTIELACQPSGISGPHFLINSNRLSQVSPLCFVPLTGLMHSSFPYLSHTNPAKSSLFPITPVDQ